MRTSMIATLSLTLLSVPAAAAPAPAPRPVPPAARPGAAPATPAVRPAPIPAPRTWRDPYPRPKRAKPAVPPAARRATTAPSGRLEFPGRRVRTPVRRDRARSRRDRARSRRDRARSRRYRRYRRRLVRRFRPMPPERPWHIRVTSRSQSLLVRESSFDVFKRNDLVSRGEVNLGVEYRLPGNVRVAGEAGYAGGKLDDTLMQELDTRLDHHSLLMGAWVGYRLWDAVTPYVRAGLAVTWVKGTVEGSGLSMGGRDVAAGGYALGGVEIGLPRRWLWSALRSTVFSMALTVEAGYMDLGRFSLDGGINRDGLVDEHRASLGTLKLRGAAINAGLLLSF